jgi:hypothetical protein
VKNSHEITQALEKCMEAQKADDPKLCPIYPKDESLTCLDCTCRDALKWVLEDEPQGDNPKISEKIISCKICGESDPIVLCTMPDGTVLCEDCA